MGNYIGSKMMMDIAKESIHNFLKEVPEEANISFRVYGHKGTGSRDDQELSCEAIEQVYGYAPYDENSFQQELDKIQPAGWTPLAEALKQAEEALKEFDTENNTNLIYVVSDGIETCGGDPVSVAKSLSDSDAKPIINIIGFNVDNDAQRQLREMAEVSGGIFAVANDQSELEDEFKRAEEVLKAWDDWKRDALKDVERLRVRSSFDFIEFTNDWWPKVLRQSNNLNRVLREAYNEELITMQQRDYLQRKNNEVQDFIDNVQDELEEQLKEISTETIESMKEMIEERYDANIDE